MTKIAICSHLAFLETGSELRQTECMCFADSAMIMHVVYRRTQKFLHAASGIYHALCTMYIAARAGDGRTIHNNIHIYRLRTFNSSMWGSLRLAPIMLHVVYTNAHSHVDMYTHTHTHTHTYTNMH